jgi:hypothetical protein
VHGGVDAELLGELARERIFGIFAGLDFAPREFPCSRQVRSRLSLREEHATVLDEDARADDDRVHGSIIVL